MLARRWLGIALLLLALYVSLPWVAPALARVGWMPAADVLYTIYSPFCHQFAFRSVFLFGEQAFYPRAAAGTGYAPFEVYAADSPAFQEAYSYWAAVYGARVDAPPATREGLAKFSAVQQFAARQFIGDARIGYKTSLCARDLAIWTAIFVGGLIYARLRWRIRPLPLWLFVVAGLGPISLDGFSQLLSYPPFELWAVRETTPQFRLLTGAIFGLMSAWLGFPHIERSMQDLRLLLGGSMLIGIRLAQAIEALLHLLGIGVARLGAARIGRFVDDFDATGMRQRFWLLIWSALPNLNRRASGRASACSAIDRDAGPSCWRFSLRVQCRFQRRQFIQQVLGYRAVIAQVGFRHCQERLLVHELPLQASRADIIARLQHFVNLSVQVGRFAHAFLDSRLQLALIIQRLIQATPDGLYGAARVRSHIGFVHALARQGRLRRLAEQVIHLRVHQHGELVKEAGHKRSYSLGAEC